MCRVCDVPTASGGTTRGCGAGTYGNEREGACPVDSDAKGELEFAVFEGAVVEASTAGERGCRSRQKVDLSDAVGTPVLRCKEGAGTMSEEHKPVTHHHTQ